MIGTGQDLDLPQVIVCLTQANPHAEVYVVSIFQPALDLLGLEARKVPSCFVGSLFILALGF